MNLIWQSVKFDAANVVRQYVARIGNEYKIYDVNTKSQTIRERWCLRDEIPDNIANEADRQKGLAFNQVRLEQIIP